MAFTGIVSSRESVLRREQEHGGGRPSVISRSRTVAHKSLQEMRQTCPRDEEEEKSSMMEKTFIGRMFLEALDKATDEAEWDVSDEAKALLRRAFNASAMAATQSVPAKVHAQVESSVDPDGQYPLYYRNLGHSRVVGKNCTVRLKLSNTQQKVEQLNEQPVISAAPVEAIVKAERLELESTHLDPHSYTGRRGLRKKIADRAAKRPRLATSVLSQAVDQVLSARGFGDDDDDGEGEDGGDGGTRGGDPYNLDGGAGADAEDGGDGGAFEFDEGDDAFA